MSSNKFLLASGVAAAAAGAYFVFVGFGETPTPKAGDAKGLGLVTTELKRTIGDAKEVVARLADGDIKGAVHGAEHTVEHSLPGREVRHTVTAAERVPVAGFGAYEAKKSYQLGKRGVDKVMSGNVLGGAADLVAASPVGTAYRAVWDLFSGQRGKDEAARVRAQWGDIRDTLTADLQAHRDRYSAADYKKEQRFIKYADRAFNNVAEKHGGPLWLLQHHDEAVTEAHAAAEAIYAADKAAADRQHELQVKADAERAKVEAKARAAVAAAQQTAAAAKSQVVTALQRQQATKEVLSHHAGGAVWAAMNQAQFAKEVQATLANLK